MHPRQLSISELMQCRLDLMHNMQWDTGHNVLNNQRAIKVELLMPVIGNMKVVCLHVEIYSYN